ncbi:hypothetical protein [Nostoc sphaeroides]|uniref:hypothetical protein n=1 Tax=Nostoc sphaeroides TaxID=446679 RepID=UPI00126A2E33|nr:hypothetical protein [Nostoc sphaeroides]
MQHHERQRRAVHSTGNSSPNSSMFSTDLGDATPKGAVACRRGHRRLLTVRHYLRMPSLSMAL